MAVSHPQPMPRAMRVLCLGVFINRFGTFVLPFLVLYLTKLGRSPSAAGMTLSAYGVGAVIGSFGGGALSDRIGPRATIVGSMVASAVAVMALSEAHHLALLCVVALAAGATGDAFRPAAMAMVADLTPPGREQYGAALFRRAAHVGFAAGPIAGGLLADHSFKLLFVADALCSMLFATLAVVGLPATTHKHTNELPPSTSWLRGALANRRYVRFLIATAAVATVTGQMDSTLALHVKDHGHTTATFGLLLAVNAVLIVLLEVSVATITQRFATNRVVAVGFLITGVGFACTAAATGAVPIGATIAIWTLGEMISAPASNVYAANFAAPAVRGRYVGLFASSQAASSVIGPSIGTLAYQWHPNVVWLGSGLLGLAAAALVARGDAAGSQRLG